MGYVIDNEQLMKEWNWEKNNNLGVYPDKIKLKSKKKIWWICKEGHEWCAIAKDRSRGIDCPVCRKKKINNIKLIDVKGVIDNGT